MKTRLLMVLVLALTALILMGAGTTTYRGIVMSNDGNKLVLLMQNNQERTFRTSASTRVFFGEATGPVSKIKRNMRVQLAVNNSDVCVQIVTEGVPK